MNANEILSLLDHLQPDEPLGELLRATCRRYSIPADDADLNAARQLLDAAHERRAAGMAGGWVSFDFFTKMLAGGGMIVTANRANEILKACGYVRHPGLDRGRTNNKVRPDNRKTRLYVRPDHPTVNWRRTCDIERAYERDQGFTGNVP